MKEQKIIENQQISWFDEKGQQLDYRQLFEDQHSPSDKQKKEAGEEKKQAAARRKERDRRWKNKLKSACDKAYNQGYREGCQRGEEKAGAEIDQKIAALKDSCEKAHREWHERQKLLNPGLLDLIFDITESILEIPVDNPAIRKKLDRELGRLLQKVDEEARPVLRVSQSDYEYVKRIQKEKKAAPTISFSVSPQCNPGEFELETRRETVVHRYKKMLQDFKDNLTLPSWK